MGAVDDPAQLAGRERGRQRHAVGVVEHEQVERDVGVDDDGAGFCQGSWNVHGKYCADVAPTTGAEVSLA
jgi:hypothetical protein